MNYDNKHEEFRRWASDPAMKKELDAARSDASYLRYLLGCAEERVGRIDEFLERAIQIRGSLDDPRYLAETLYITIRLERFYLNDVHFTEHFRRELNHRFDQLILEHRNKCARGR